VPTPAALFVASVVLTVVVDDVACDGGGVELFKCMIVVSLTISTIISSPSSVTLGRAPLFCVIAMPEDVVEDGLDMDGVVLEPASVVILTEFGARFAGGARGKEGMCGGIGTEAGVECVVSFFSIGTRSALASSVAVAFV
jgi:hypothetical protein